MEPDVSHLPDSAQRLVALIGLPATVVLVEKHGGKEVRLYVRGDSVKRLGEVIGQQAAERLHDYFGREPFDVPRCTAALKGLRNTKIHATYDQMTATAGLSGRTAVHTIVEQFGLTERQVWRILKMSSAPRQAKQKPVDTRQLSLI
jgi:hypothetical protein